MVCTCTVKSSVYQVIKSTPVKKLFNTASWRLILHVQDDFARALLSLISLSGMYRLLMMRDPLTSRYFSHPFLLHCAGRHPEVWWLRRLKLFFLKSILFSCDIHFILKSYSFYFHVISILFSCHTHSIFMSYSFYFHVIVIFKNF